MFLQILGVLCQDGIMRFINIHTCKLIFDIGSHDVRITNVSLGPTGRHVVCVLDTGDIRVYSVQALTQEVNKVRHVCHVVLVMLCPSCCARLVVLVMLCSLCNYLRHSDICFVLL